MFVSDDHEMMMVAVQATLTDDDDFINNPELEAAIKMSLDCHQDDDDPESSELEMAIRMSLECHEDVSDVDATELNN